MVGKMRDLYQVCKRNYVWYTIPFIVKGLHLYLLVLTFSVGIDYLIVKFALLDSVSKFKFESYPL